MKTNPHLGFCLGNLPKTGGDLGSLGLARFHVHFRENLQPLRSNGESDFHHELHVGITQHGNINLVFKCVCLSATPRNSNSVKLWWNQSKCIFLKSSQFCDTVPQLQTTDWALSYFPADTAIYIFPDLMRKQTTWLLMTSFLSLLFLFSLPFPLHYFPSFILIKFHSFYLILGKSIEYAKVLFFF